MLAKLARWARAIAEVPVDLDTSRRIGKSKMPVVAHDPRLLADGSLRERVARSSAEA